jgi:hypothetical protein
MLMTRWRDFVAEISLEPPLIKAGSQAIYDDKRWVLDANALLDDESMQLSNIGFTPTKIKQLTRHYQNTDSIRRASSDLDDRLRGKKYGSGVWDFRGEPKKTTKQDFCITAGVVAYYPSLRTTRLTVYYRTVELIFRFRADLIFFRDVILPQFDLDTVPPDTITLHFTNCTVHPMFGIFLLMELEHPEDYLYQMCESNPDMATQWLRWTKIHLEGGYKSYMTAARVQKHVEAIYPKKLKSLLKIVNAVSKNSGLGK